MVQLRCSSGTIANIGVHDVKADLHLERLWSHNITITTRLVDTVTTPMLLKTRADPARSIRSGFSPLQARQDLNAMTHSSRALSTRALKVLIEA